jgi:hypothetical protein
MVAVLKKLTILATWWHEPGSMLRNYRFVLATVCCLALVGVSGSIGSADSGNNGVTQSYNADKSVLPGMTVELKPNGHAVEPLKAADIDNMLGVVVPANDAPIVLTPQSTSTQQVLVATAGHYNLLVSSQNGPVKANDYLTASAVPGIAMKATSDQKEIVGRAASGFSSGSNVLGTVPLKGSLGHTTTVLIGSVQANVQLAPNPLFQGSSKLPDLLAKAANNVTNKTVSPVRIYLSLIVLVTVIIIVGSMLYASVHGSMVSIGRNPLAKRAIGWSLIRTFIYSLIVFIVGILAAYVILI